MYYQNVENIYKTTSFDNTQNVSTDIYVYIVQIKRSGLTHWSPVRKKFNFHLLNAFFSKMEPFR